MFDRKILEEISKSRGYNIALLTTFNFEVNFFERQILNSLYDNNVKKVDLFVDSKELVKSIQEPKNNFIGKKYLIHPMEMNASFHPKVILLLGDDKAKLIISSANIKTSGYMINNEIYNVFEYDKENKDNLNLIIDAYNFFKELHEMSKLKDKEVFDELEQYIYLHRKVETNGTYLLHNINESIFAQFKSIVKENIRSIDIAVPYYDNELSAIKAISETYPNSKIKLYIQNEKSTFPIKYNETNGVVNDQFINTFNSLISNNSSNFYHGKVFRFNTENKSYVLYGSSNCTLSALIKSYKDGGNIECDVLESDSPDAFDYFFDNFKIDNSQELKANTMEYEAPPKLNYNFKYGLLKDDLNLYIGYKIKSDKIEVYLEESKLEYTYEENLLVIKIGHEQLNHIDNMFDIKIKIDDSIEILKCWYIDMYSIMNYRNTNRDIGFNNISLDEDMNKYREHIELILKTLALNSEEYDEQKRLKKLFSQNKTSELDDDKDEDEIDDDFIIDTDIPDEYINKNRNLSIALSKSRMFSNRFFSNYCISQKNEKKEKQNNINDTEITTKTNKTKRRATSSEKRFERFVKNRVKGMLNDEYVEMVEYSHYKNSVGIILDVIHEFKQKENIEDIFDDKYVIETTFALLNKLINKDIQKSTNEDRENIIILTLMTILENEIINSNSDDKDYKVELTNKKFLQLLDRLYNIRENYKEYLEVAINLLNNKFNIENNIDEYSLSFAEKYIDDLFEYKTRPQLLSILKRYYGEESSINFENNNIYVKTCLEDITKYMSKEAIELKELIKQLRNYSKNQYKINSLIVDIIKTDKSKNLIRIKYETNIINGITSSKMYYANNPEPILDSYQIR